MPDAAVAALIEHRQFQTQAKELFGSDYADHNLIFCRPDGEYYRPDKVSVRVTELARKLGLVRVGLHSLRHTHASELLSKGAPLPAVADRRGHSSPKITLEIYAHPISTDDAASAKLWNDALASVITDNKKAGTERMLAREVRKIRK